MRPPTVADGPVVIVGAGVTGLSIAQFLAEAGVEVVVVERLGAPGGLARSFRYDAFVFDVGPHRFHTSNPHVTTWLDRVLGEDKVSFPRHSEVFFHGRYYRWPLKPQELVRLPPTIAARSGLDLALNTFRTYRIDSFEEYILRQYGPTLYAHFFRDYTEDFLGLHPRDTHPDWAKAGINRAIIDDKLEMQNLSQLLKSTLLQFGKSEIDFLYPRGGMSVIWERLVARLEAGGVRILLGTPAHLVARGNRVVAVHAGEDRIRPSVVIWTGPIGTAAAQLGLPATRLDYRSLVLYNVMLEGDVPRRYQWCYYGEKDFVFSRISAPRFFHEATCPPGTTGLCVEVTCQEGDHRWQQAERLTDWVVEDLVRVRMLPDRRLVRDVRIERICDAYPIYHKDYPADLERTTRAFALFDNLHMAGRCGTFWYNNMDHCVEAAFDLTRRLLFEAGIQSDEAALAAGPSDLGDRAHLADPVRSAAPL